MQIGEENVGVRIAVRDLKKQGESQIYNWGIKKDASLGDVRDDLKNRKRYGASSEASSDTSLDGVQPVISDSSHGVSSKVSINIIPQSRENTTGLLRKVQNDIDYAAVAV